MSLVHAEGFEYPFSYANFDGLPQVSTEGSTAGITIQTSGAPQPSGGSGNGTRFLQHLATPTGFKATRLLLPSHARKRAGIVSWLYRQTDGTASVLRTVMAVLESSGLTIAAAVYVSRSGSTWTFRLDAGGSTNLATFTHVIGSWDRWAMVWDTTGTNVTIAVYINGTLKASATGGTGRRDDSHTLRIINLSNSGAAVPTQIDSITVWDDPVGDLSAATGAHWVAPLTLTEPDAVSRDNWTASDSGATILARWADTINPITTHAGTDTDDSPLTVEWAFPGYMPTAIHGLCAFARTRPDADESELEVAIQQGSDEVADTVTLHPSTAEAVRVTAAVDPESAAQWTPQGVVTATATLTRK